MSPEVRRLLNPSFLATVNAVAAEGFVSETGDGLPFLYAFLIPPLVLNKETRDSLPSKITSRMPAWAHDSASVLAFLPQHAQELQDAVRLSILVGTNQGQLILDEHRRLRPGADTSLAESSRLTQHSIEIPDILKRSYFVGRWLSVCGNTPTVFSVLGIGL